VLPPIKTVPGQVIDGVTLRLTRPAIVRRKVVDAKGKAVAGREVRAQAIDKLENRYYDPTTTTQEDGTFELKYLRPTLHQNRTPEPNPIRQNQTQWEPSLDALVAQL
jgi:hypothetical protein